MASSRRIALSIAVTAMVTATSLAALSEQHVQFGKGPAQFVMTKEELAQWKNIKDDAAAQAFIDLFWARRDPSPNTPVNEFRDQFDARVKAADDNYTRGRVKGSMSDRGKVLIILGKPSRMERNTTAPTSTIQTGASSGEGQFAQAGQADRPRQVWIYDQTKVNFPLPQPIVEVAFIDQFGSEDWKLERTPRTDYVRVFQEVNQRMITQPQLTQAPKMIAPQAAKTPPAVAPLTAPASQAPAAMTTFKTQEFQNAVEAFPSAKTNPYGKPLFMSWGEFVTPQNERFVAISLQTPRTSAMSADQELTLFGSVKDEKGSTIAVFEEPVKLSPSGSDLIFDKTVALPPGKYNAVMGLAQNGKPLAMTSTPMNVIGLDKDAPGVSNLILSNNIFPLSKPQEPTDPFAFGGMKVVPKSNKQFSKTDELWYFAEIRNPGLDENGQPSVQIKIDIEGTTAAGKKILRTAPPRPATLSTIKDLPGRYYIGESFAASIFAPGDYTMKVKVTDTVKKASYNLQESFKVVEGTM